MHIVTAVGWLGAAMVFGMLIGPTLPTLTPASRGELIVKLLPRYLVWGEVFALSTPVIGLVLALYISHGEMSIFSFSLPDQGFGSNHFGTYISIGALLSVVLWAIAFGGVFPAARKVVWFTREMMKNQAPTPPAGLTKASKRLQVTSSVALVIMLVVVACMVYAATG